MILDIPSAKCTRDPKYTSGGSRQLWYFSTLTHSLPTLELARELIYGALLFLSHCVSLVLCIPWWSNEEGMASFYRWRGGGPWKMLHPLMESTKPPICASRVRPHPNWARMPPSLVCCLPWASRWVLQSFVPFRVDLIWVLALFLHLTRPWFAS